VFFHAFDGNDNSLWLTGAGSIDGVDAMVPLTITTGRKFPPNSDPLKIVRNP